MKQLEESDFPFEDGKLVKSRIRWDERFEELVAYKTKHKMDFAHIPQTKNQNNPYYSLGTWCALQKLRRKGIRPPIWTEYEEQKMNDINFLWETFGAKISGTPLDRKWFENYFKLEEYKTKTGNANPSQVDKDLEIKKLAKWVNDQRTLRNTGRKKSNGEIIKLTKEREEWLIDLGVDFDYQLNIRKANLEKFIVTYLEFKKEYPDGKGVRGDIRFSKMLEMKASIKYSYKNDKSEEGKWRIDRLNEIGFDWT